MLVKHELENWNWSDFHDGWIDLVCDMVATASPEKRQKIKERVERAVAREDSKYTVSGYVDCSMAVECGGGYCWGNNYLYVWFDREGKPFYVGQAADTNRIYQFEYKTRSERFQDKIREGGCHSAMVAKHIVSGEIDKLEKNLMAYLAWKGHSLVNQRDMPSKEQLTLWNMFEKQKDRASVRKNLGDEALDLYIEWEQTMKELAPIVSVLESMIGVRWDGECAEFKPKMGQVAEKVSWNGQEKTYLEWAKEPGCSVTHATIKGRIAKGWTMAEALFTPSWSKVDGATLEERQTLYDSYRAQARAKGERMTA